MSKKITDKFIISGLGPSQSGAGRLVAEIMEYAKKEHSDVGLIYIYAKKNSVFKVLKNSFIGNFLKYIYYKYLTQNTVKTKLSVVKNSRVLIIHPQTLGFDNVYKLVEQGNMIFFYMMDCGFFCLQSYNHIAKSLSPCLQCLGSGSFEPAIKNNCTAFPVSYKPDVNIEFLKFLKENYRSFYYILQNKNQEILLKKHFGSDCETFIAGMYTNELLFGTGTKAEPAIACDIVYHGSLDDAKGILYVLELAGHLKTYSLLIAYPRAMVTTRTGISEFSENIVFEEMTWETGLREAVENAKIVLNPSLWSAPIEGAILKSIGFNGCVGLLNSAFSFSSELLAEGVGLELTLDISKSAEKINEVITNKASRNEYINTAKEYLISYTAKKKEKQKQLFKLVFSD